ncbi:hypothetical protein TSUD_366950 [Trifolium subterraneum]|uniref:Uncharacterized protein n=1 Tax=Trifolium subterraneum TaxID=3900 RepID=A0A2Z6NUN4_TRISU|nr:hypothetical protein TSUD_366950 [Trifolium subterraneum]
MAVGKRPWSRDEHLMLIIPMLGVTNLRGDVRCPTVMQHWACALGLARRPSRGGPQRVGHSGPVQNRSPPSHHARARDWSGALKFEQARSSGIPLYKDKWRDFFKSPHFLTIQLPEYTFSLNFHHFLIAIQQFDSDLSLQIYKQGWLTPFPSHEMAVLMKTAVFRVDSRYWAFMICFRAFIPLRILDSFRVFLEFPRNMADEGVQRKIPVEKNMNWVADDPRTTPSKFEFEEHFPEDLFTDIEVPGHADWEVRIPGARQRICSVFKNGGFPMYQIAFEHMGLRLPFTDLEMAIFNHLELCPSQLHANSLAFIRAFEVVAAYLQLAPTVPLFFHIFGIQRSRPRGNVTDKCGWVSLKQHKKYFEIFEESLRGFKDKWYVVRPITSAGWKTILVRGPKLDDEGRVKHGDDGEPIEVDCECFPFCWSKKHYAREAKSFTFRKGALSKEELADLKALEDFVEEFPPSLWEDREGNPICDEEGYQLSSKKFINTKALLRCTTRAEAEDLFREMKSTAATLRKLQAGKKRRQAGGASSSAPVASGQSSPSRSIEVTGERRVVEEVVDDQRPPKHARFEGGGVVSGSRRLVPGKAAAEFVFPPAMGHDCLLDGKTTVKIPEADQTILASMGPESLRNVVTESSVAVFKLLEVATFLNGRECKFLRERDEVRALAKDFGERLTVVERDLLARDKALEESAAEVARAKKGLEDAKGEEEKLKLKIAELEEQISGLSLAEEEEKKLDPAGTYAKFSRADLIAKVYQIGDLQLDVASSSFQNALAQLQVLNPGIQLLTEGLDELKEVRDGQIATPPLDEE